MELNQEEQRLVLSSKLFAGFGGGRLPGLLDRLEARRNTYRPGEFVLKEGDQVEQVGLVLAGQGRSVKTGAKGEQLIISLLERGSFLGVLLAASRERKSPVSVQARELLSVLFIPADRLISPEGLEPEEHERLLRNFLDSVAEQSLALNDRISCLIRPSVREKVRSYLLRQAQERGSREFSIPLDRAALAGYLNVERSALSRELSRMRADGLIEYRMNRFQLLDLH